MKSSCVITLCLVLFSALAAAQDSRPWAAGLDLASKQIKGGTLYYDKSLEPKLEIVAVAAQDFLAEMGKLQERSAGLAKQADSVFADLDKMVGGQVSEEAKANRAKVFQAMLSLQSQPKVLAVVTQGPTKAYLRKGNTIPNFTYDKASDTVTYQARAIAGAGPAGALDELFIPLPGADSAEKDIKNMTAAILHWLGQAQVMALQEASRMSILDRLRPFDPYYRWFSEGFASALTRRLMEKHVSPAAAAEYDPRANLKAFADLQKELNLYYWMGPEFAIDAPLPAEARLADARAAYAAFEAERLTEAHGIDVLSKVLDRLGKDATNDSRKLFPAIKQVTGEDLQAALLRYQGFTSESEGLKKYAQVRDAAMEKKDYASALPAVIRLAEMKAAEHLLHFSAAAALLHRMGQDQAAEEVFAKLLRTTRLRGMTEGLQSVQRAFLLYAFQTDQPAGADEVAQEVLKRDPSDVPAMAVRMLNLAKLGKADEARQLAQRLLKLEPDKESPFYKAAARLAQ